LYTPSDFELDEGHVIKNEKVALDTLRVRQNVFLVVIIIIIIIICFSHSSACNFEQSFKYSARRAKSIIDLEMFTISVDCEF